MSLSYLKKGQFSALNVTQEARHRIFVGLGWDPKGDVNILDKARELVGGRKAYHDLDLSCYLYTAERSFIQSVSGTGNNSDDSGHVYHSGDNLEGIGDGDDEQISVELKDLDRNIHHIIFTATIKSGHTFGDVSTPEIHLSDGYSNYAFLRSSLSHAEGKGKTGFVFVHLYRSDDSWMMHNISEFVKAQDLEEWPALIVTYLQTQESDESKVAQA